jgi:saccharopine dehydrogenase-like NADP-dependent oxidoreductase
VTWSIDGLINEYKDDCLILEDGEIKTARGMDGLVELETEKLGKLEAFYTSGGASHSIYSMQARGVKNCSYKTLRYVGHGKIIKFLIRDCTLSDEVLNKIFVEGCGYAEKDEVIVLTDVKGEDITWHKEILVKSDEQFSAMQKATAFSISAVAAIMAEGKLEGNKEERRGYWLQYNKSLSYADVPFDRFNKNLNKLGLDI